MESWETHRGAIERLAEKLANTLPPQAQAGGLGKDDLFQVAVMGFIDAQKRWKPDNGAKLGTFCMYRATFAMLDYIRENDWVPRLVRRRKQKAPMIGSLDVPTVFCRPDARKERDNLADIIPDRHRDDTLRIDDADEADTVMRQADLDSHDRLMMRLYHQEDFTMKQAGSVVGVSESRISQRHSLAKLRLEVAARDYEVRRAV